MKTTRTVAAIAAACLLSVVIGFSTGCASLGKLMTPAAVPFVQVAVDVAVAAAVGTDPAAQKTKASQIKAIAQQLLLVDQGEAVTLTALQAIVNAKVASLNLPPADVAAAMLLTQALTDAVTAEISTATQGAVSPATQVAIAQVLNDVISATTAFGA